MNLKLLILFGSLRFSTSSSSGKYASAGSDWKTSGETQLRWMMGYIKDRYGDPTQPGHSIRETIVPQVPGVLIKIKVPLFTKAK